MKSTAAQTTISGLLISTLVALGSACAHGSDSITPLAAAGAGDGPDSGVAAPQPTANADVSRPLDPTGIDGIPDELDVTVQATPWDAYLAASSAYRGAAAMAAVGDLATHNGFVDPMLGDVLADLHSMAERDQRRVMPPGRQPDATLVTRHVNSPDEVVLEVCVRDPAVLIDAPTGKVIEGAERIDRLLVEMRFGHDRWAQSKQQYLASVTDGHVTSTDRADGTVGCFGV